jgi:hypothetical protein
VTKSLAFLAAASLAVVPAAALAGSPLPESKPDAKSHANRAKTYKAKLKAVGADAAYFKKKVGRAQLVDGKKNNKVSIHVRGLTPGATYLWHVHQAKKAGDPCAEPTTVGNPAPYPAFNYKAVKANAAGNFNRTLKSTTFPLPPAQDTGQVFYVNVHLADGTVIACGVLKGSRKAASGPAKRKGGKGGHPGGTP